MENETGLTRDVVRKWETRYGFPRPERDANGTRVYPAEQVASLRLIRQLLSTGFRPSKIVGLDLASLETMAEQLAPPTDAQIVQDKFIQEALEALREHNLARLSKHLKRAFYLQGLPSFLRQSLHPLVVAIGESWKRGDIRIFEEHLFSQVTCDLLHEAIGTVANHAGSPRVLLATPPKELHTLGLLMANIELSLQGACCLGLGAQTPEAEIAEAVGACGIDIVGLGFSAAFSKREAARFASGLRHQLESAIEIWVGGQGAAHLSQIAGVSHIRDLDELDCAILAWRERHR